MNAKFKVGDKVKNVYGECVLEIIGIETIREYRVKYGNGRKSTLLWDEKELIELPKPLTAVEALGIFMGLNSNYFPTQLVGDMQKVLDAIKERGIA